MNEHISSCSSVSVSVCSFQLLCYEFWLLTEKKIHILDQILTWDKTFIVYEQKFPLTIEKKDTRGRGICQAVSFLFTLWNVASIWSKLVNNRFHRGPSQGFQQCGAL